MVGYPVDQSGCLGDFQRILIFIEIPPYENAEKEFEVVGDLKQPRPVDIDLSDLAGRVIKLVINDISTSGNSLLGQVAIVEPRIGPGLH